MPWTIYCHTHIETGRRYVGMTARTMERRWSQHLIQARSAKGGRWHFPNAIRKQGPQAFSHEVLEVCHSLEVANLAEECWIELYGTRDPAKGFNLAKGGQHIPHPIRRNPWDDPGFREVCIANLARVNASMTHEERSERAKRLWANPEFASKVTTTSKKTWSDIELRVRQSESQREVKARPEVRTRQSQASLELWRSPEYRTKKTQLWEDPDYRRRCQSGLTHGASLNASKTHCRNGHEYSLENTLINSKGSRVCRVCDRSSQIKSVRKARSLDA